MKFLKFILIFLLGHTIHSQAQSNQDTLEWTPELSMQIKSIAGTDISPDGQFIAYAVREPAMEGEKSEYVQQIWVSAVNGSGNFQYTRHEKSSFAPAVSPDGQYLAFISSRGEKNQVWIMRLMGGEPRPITDEPNGIQSFQWSPDGKTIAFLKTDEDTEDEEKQKKEKRYVIQVDQNFKYNHLYVIDPFDESEDLVAQRLTSGPFHITSFDWSPDSKQLVFSHKEDPRINTSRIDAEISVVPADSGAIKTIVSRPGPDTHPKFSPDGQHIVFQSTGGQMEPIGLSDLYITDPRGENIISLAHTPDRNASIIDWSADGNYVYVQESHHTSRVAMKVSTTPNSNESPMIISSINGVSSSFDINHSSNTLAYVYQTTNQAPEVYISDLAGVVPKKISSINSTLHLPKMGETEVITWTSSDGLEVEGLLTYPIGYQVGEKYPLVLQIHGGPAGVFSQSFTGGPSIYMTQYFAQQGMAILRPNPRGSTGYGKDFRYANFKDWGFGDYEDLMSGVDKIIDMGIANEQKMAVMGWSYGGYLTSYLVTKTDRFKAASMGAGLPNLISMVNTTDIPDYLVGHFGNEFWNDYDTYEKHSAMYRIRNVTTPTQIIHGEKDLRVPFTQGQEFYTALSRRGVATEMIVLPRTPHGPREPKLLMEVSPRILDWFSKYIDVKP